MDSGESLRDPREEAQLQRDVDKRDPRTWSSGADVPLTASISTMSDKQLGRALCHHKFVFKLPKEWWYNTKRERYEACTAVATSCVKINGRFYINCSIVSPSPSQRAAHELQFPVGSSRGFTKWNVRLFLSNRYNKPATLQDIGLTELPGQPGVTAMLAAWTFWATNRALTPEDGLSDIGILEPDPKSYKQALRHLRLAPFWVESAKEEMEGLWR
eukprot:3931812-Rhodomonas_salina.1